MLVSRSVLHDGQRQLLRWSGSLFSKSKAVTADHNLIASQVVGTQVVVQIPGNGSTQLCQDASNLFV